MLFLFHPIKLFIYLLFAPRACGYFGKCRYSQVPGSPTLKFNPCVSEHQHNALAGGKSSQSLLPASSNSCSQWIDKPKSSLCSDSLGTWSGLSGRLTPAKSPFKCPVILPAWSWAHCYNLPKCHRYYYPGSLPTCAQVPTERWGQQKVVVTTGYRQRKDAGQLGRTISEGKGRW